MSNRTALLLGALILVGSACGGGDSDSTNGTAPATSSTTLLPESAPLDSGPEPTSVDTATEPPTTTSTTAAPPAGVTTTTVRPVTTTEPAPAPSGTAGSAGLGDSFYPLLGNGGYDAVHYEIDLDVDPSANTIDASTTLSAVATQDLSSFNLDLSGLHVDSITVDGEEAAFSRAGAELTVLPSAVIPDGDLFSVMVSYSGTPESLDDPGVPFTKIGWHRVDGVIFTTNEPSGAMTWFPGNNHPTDKATFTFRITVPAGVTAAATGVLVSEDTGEDTTTFTWQMDDPMTTYLAAVYIGDFERRERRLDDGLLIRDYVPPGIDPTLTEALTVASDAISYFETIFGPYPFDAYGTIVLPFPAGYALENQTLSVHGMDRLQPGIIAHEVMHQWIGNSVTVADWSDVWMLEGFATYLSWMFLAQTRDFDLEARMAELHETLIDQNVTAPKRIGLPQLFDFAAVYGRGAMTLHALREEVGDATFLDILRAHYERSAGSHSTTAEFLDLVAELGGDRAGEVTRSWLFDIRVPGSPANS